DPLAREVEPFGKVMRAYQRYVWLPGTVYGLILVAGLVALGWRWRRSGREALLPWATSLALIVIPAATAEFDYRYVTTAVPFACLAAALAFSPGTAGGKLARRLGKRGQRPGEAGQVIPAGEPAVGDPVVGERAAAPAGGARDDHRDLAADGT